ncbi:DUF922 domain-containing protein [Sulfitobacter noctilucicola]|nr:DUF922 domain-containing protein [Sulfitobacter noctilucicola]
MAISPALAAGPKITEVNQVYLVSALTPKALIREFRKKGPKGFTALTNWEVRWDAACNVELTLTYTLPKHTNPQAMTADVRASFDRMMANLLVHERKHGQHGINAAQEVKLAGCKNAAPIIRKYIRADRELDRRTKNGRTDGVILK